MPESAQPTFSAIYNSLRYDVDAHTVTFHLRERDWNELKSNSWMWISSSYLVPVINCEDVRLGDEIVESVSRIDPVEKFGLFSVQTFNVTGFNENDKVIKVSLNIRIYSPLGHIALLRSRWLSIRLSDPVLSTETPINGNARIQCKTINTY